jgi:hypothetical protein
VEANSTTFFLPRPLGVVTFDPEPSLVLEAATVLSFNTGPPLDFKSAPLLGLDPGSVGFERIAPFIFKLVTSCALRLVASLCFVTVTPGTSGLLPEPTPYCLPT